MSKRLKTNGAAAPNSKRTADAPGGRKRGGRAGGPVADTGLSPRPAADNGLSPRPAADKPVSEALPSTTAAELKDRRPEFLWDRRIPIGMATLLTGETQMGKSSLATLIAAAVTTGKALPGGPKIDAGNVVWCAAEEHPETTIKPRLLAAGADLRRVHFPGWNADGEMVRRPRLTSGGPELRDFVRERGGRLLIIDPVGSFLDRDMAEDNGHTAREVMQALTDLAQQAGCGALVIKHPRKGSSGNPLDQVSGSKEWVNAPRSALAVCPHPNKEDLRVFTSLVCKLGQKPPSLEFAIEYPEGISLVKFLRESSLTVDDVFQGQGDVVERSALATAKDILRDQLEAGEKASNDLLLLAERSGVSKTTMRRAKHVLGVTDHPNGPNEKRYWVWRKPAGGWPK